MMFIRGHAVMCSPASGTNPFHEIVFNEDIENPVYRHAVNRLGSFDGVKYFSGCKRGIVTTDHLHYMDPIQGRFKSCVFE